MSKGSKATISEASGSIHGLTPVHLAHLAKTSDKLATADGRQIELWALSVPADSPHLSSWARAFRSNYCLDTEIDALRAGTGLSRAQYLVDLVFPDKSKAPGPAVRSGDFAELLVADYVEHLLGYWVPRGKYAEKAARDESVKGVDILGFKMDSDSSPSPSDALLTFEVKAQLTDDKYSGRLQTAIDDSSNDYVRRAMTLNATKRRLRRAGENDKVLVVQRFQNPTDHPYLFKSGAAAVLSGDAYDAAALQESTTAQHVNRDNLELIVIRGTALMTLVHALYQRAADEA